MARSGARLSHNPSFRAISREIHGAVRAGRHAPSWPEKFALNACYAWSGMW